MDRAALDALLAQKKKVLKDLNLTKVSMLKPKPVDLSKATIDGCTLSELDFSGVSFAGATLENSWIDGCNFTNCDFSGAKVSEFVGVKLVRAKFRGSQLAKAEFSGCELQGADFTDAKLDQADFMGSDLQKACFKNASLLKADLSDTQLAGADFTGAKVDGVDWGDSDLSGAIGLSVAAESDDDEDGGDDDSDDEDGDDSDDDDDDDDDDDEGDEDMDDESDYLTSSTEGTPLLVISADLAASWTSADTERAIDSLEAKDKVTVSGWVETSSVKVGKGRALVLGGETDTGFVSIEGGGVLVRGGSFDDMEGATKAVNAALTKKDWKAFPHTIDIGKGGLWVFDAALDGSDDIEEVEGEFGAVEADLAPGTYQVDILGDQDDSGPVVFIRLRK